MTRHLILSETERANKTTIAALKKDAERIRLQNEAKKKIIAMIKNVRKSQAIAK